MSTTRSYHQALLALSGNPALAAARTNLLTSINDEEIVDVITYSIKTSIPRESVNAIATRLLDELVATRADSAAVAQAGGEGHADDVQIEMRNNNHSAGASDGRAARQDTPAPTAERRAAQIPPARVTRSSTGERKRRGSSLAQVGKKRKAIRSDFEADEEPITRKDNDSTENNETGATSSSARATDNDTAASINRDIPWKQIQKRSVMTDLDLEDSDDEEDEDATEDPERAELAVLLRKEKIQIPNVEVTFYLFTGKDIQRKKLSDFPISFVKEVVMKFNQDYLKGSANRRKYQEMLKEGTHTTKCVNCYLYSDNRLYNMYKEIACAFCYSNKRLCTKVEKWHRDGVKLAIYPHGFLCDTGTDWRSIEFWVNKWVG